MNPVLNLNATRRAALRAGALATLALLPALLRPAAADTKLPVVATFSVLADVVERVGGEAVQVSSLVPAGADVHVLQPGPNGDAGR